MPLERVDDLLARRRRFPNPAVAASWKARITSEDYPLTGLMKLGVLLQLLPLIRLPEVDADLSCQIPEGALLEADRNLHALARHLPKLLSPMLPRRGRQPGWVMLVDNHGGGYWYEISTSFPESVETSLHALEDLRERLEPSDALHERLDATIDELDALYEKVAKITGRPR